MEPDDLDDDYYCMVCDARFRSPLFSITKSVERMHYFEGERLPEAEVEYAEGIGTYCSAACMASDRERLLQTEKVRVTFPGCGPIEACSRCGLPVDMSKSHDTWTEEQDVMSFSWGDMDVLQPQDVVVLAVACRGCSHIVAESVTSQVEASKIDLTSG